ncbi:Het-C-domain-containing protein [Pleomassaria siparia CBS 279.74]|uniref:Het-C-domain-containing protein n=1 Tax=Pleomassaria siparia CBS 279.74 TaxID=1314801 RepID=A0A6G1KL77_9PLEO|nr:Het-C-domain-containing protein [Pleomassaria siparia CBS 279.74]
MPRSEMSFGSLLLPCAILLIFWARPTHAFGAGNIASLSKIEGQNWRHGDIEDTLLTLLISSSTGKKFSKMDVKRVYFGNWLRDYSQAVDVGTVKNISAEAIRILLWVLGFMSFGYGTKEFEVTRDRLGCYRPEEHIDNPKDYADNLDARDYDPRLRGPVDEQRELSVDERTGLKNYIASEDAGIVTSAGMVRDLFRRCIDLGRRSGGNGPDFYEALRLLGTACHCLEDYSAHSNYTELTLIELGERDVFPHVGRRSQIRLQGARDAVYPIVTGTFGGVDFLHSVMGEFNDKATQSELQELEGAITDAGRKENKSMIKDLLSQLPDGIFGGKDQASKADELEDNANVAKMNNLHVTPKEPEAFTEQMGELVKQIYPIMEFHDEIMQDISKIIEDIPLLPELLENLQEQINIFVFSLLAPFVLPIISQVKAELETGSSEVIASSREKQHIVFNDDESTDPTHSMISKDHFSNVLNEPAGRIASEVLKWTVPQIVKCWDNDGEDAERTIQRIITGVFHHPAQRDSGDDGARDVRNIMFGTVQNWWSQLSDRAKDDLRDKLSRDGVEQGRNHKEGVHDKGHGCGKPLGMANDISGIGGKGGNKQFQQVSNQAGKMASEAVGGGALGGLVGGLVGGLGGSLLGGAFGRDEKETKQSKQYGDDGSYTQSYSEKGHHKKKSQDDSERYGQANYSRTQYPGGGQREEYSRTEQDERGGSYGYQQKTETTSYGGSGGYERHEEKRYESGNQWQTEERREGFDRKGEYYQEEKNKKHKKHGDDDNDAYHRKGSGEYKRKSQSPKRRSGEYSHGGGGGGYGGEREQARYGEEKEYGGGGRQEYGGGGRQEYGGGGRQEYGGGGRQEYGGGGRQEYGGGDSYGSQRREPDHNQRREGYGDNEGSYGAGGMPGGFEEGQGYGQQGHGQQRGYGDQGYGGGRRYD